MLLDPGYVLSLAGGAMAAVSGAPSTTSALDPPTAAPLAWSLYAANLSARIRLAATAETPSAVRLRRALGAQQGAMASTLVVRVWVDRSGRVVRVRSPDLLGETQRALETLLLGERTSAPPPVNLRQPVVMRLTLKAEDPDAGPADVHPATLASPGARD